MKRLKKLVGFVLAGCLAAAFGWAAVCIDEAGGAASCGADCQRNGTSCSCEGECTEAEIQFVLAQ